MNAINSNSNSGSRRIEAAIFQPSDDSGPKFRLSLTQIVLGTLAIATAFFLWFIFTSKSVALNFIPDATNVSIEGGFSFDLADVYLLREGTYTIRATSPQHEPMSLEINVGSERNQTMDLAFTPLPGFVNLTLQPADATVQVSKAEGQRNPIDTPPQLWRNPTELPAGPHTLVISHPRYQTLTTPIVVEGKQIEQTQQFRLLPNWAEVSVTSNPPGAQIFIDDVLQEATTPGVVQALAGEREIRISLAGYKSHRQRIFAQAQVPQQLDSATLTQADALALVKSTPSGAGVTVNGSFVGRTPLELELPSNKSHRVSLILNGFASQARVLNLERGENKELNVRLTQQLGEVVFTVEPEAAQLSVNGKSLGSANQTLKLPLTPHDISINLEGYAGYTQTLSPKVGITQEVRVKLLTLAEARLRALTPTITAPDGQNLLLMKPFSYHAGASRREPGRRANETLRQVELSRLFYLSTKEVTNAQFRQFASGHDSGTFVEASLNEDEQPATNLSWHDAAGYCNWLSDQSGLEPFYIMEFAKVIGVNPNAKGYRLPTESEWEWAARTQGENADELLRFPWGAALPPPDRHGNYADRAASTLVGRVIFGYNDNYAVAAPPATYRANMRGLYDMGGNVAEWTHDFYEIPSAETITDSLGPKNGEYRVIRGSSWMHGTITELRYTFRDYGIDGRADVGFRVARFAE